MKFRVVNGHHSHERLRWGPGAIIESDRDMAALHNKPGSVKYERVNEDAPVSRALNDFNPAPVNAGLEGRQGTATTKHTQTEPKVSLKDTLPTDPTTAPPPTPPTQPAPPSSQKVEAGVDDWHEEELLAYCEDHELDFPRNATNEQLLELVKAHKAGE